MDSASVERFVEAQAGGEYERALAEIRAGRKRTHWIWYVFPQARGLGTSQMAIYYGIASAAELAAYVAHPVLMPRLRMISQALLELDETNPEHVMSWIDAKKLKSCMTLFGDATDEPVFQAVLNRYYHGRADERTREIVAGWSD
ncbi:MAG: DUF1810 domain-containing protein [Coriobacteriales bacterium]|nr:DUF1810 domain-containing protein [Coriobacteriales bacterium]